MKIPNLFLPEKNLEKKTEELIDGRMEVTTKELMANNMWIIHGDTKELNPRIENIRNIALKILKDTSLGMIKWEEGMTPENYSKCYTSKAVIPNYKQEPIIVPVTFLISQSPAGVRFTNLYLGDEKGLSLKSFADSGKIDHVFMEYFLNKK